MRVYLLGQGTGARAAAASPVPNPSTDCSTARFSFSLDVSTQSSTSAPLEQGYYFPASDATRGVRIPLSCRNAQLANGDFSFLA
jgi:hypothetical protein